MVKIKKIKKKSQVISDIVIKMKNHILKFFNTISEFNGQSPKFIEKGQTLV